MAEVKKNLQEVINLIVAFEGTDEPYSSQEILDMLTGFADMQSVAAIRERYDMDSTACWDVPGEYTVKRLWGIHSYPDDQVFATTREQRDAFYKVKTHSAIWVNLLDSPWSDSRYVGWKYVITFPEEANLPGKYLVKENDLFIKEEKNDSTNYD